MFKIFPCLDLIPKWQNREIGIKYDRKVISYTFEGLKVVSTKNDR